MTTSVADLIIAARDARLKAAQDLKLANERESLEIAEWQFVEAEDDFTEVELIEVVPADNVIPFRPRPVPWTPIEIAAQDRLTRWIEEGLALLEDYGSIVIDQLESAYGRPLQDDHTRDGGH